MSAQENLNFSILKKSTKSKINDGKSKLEKNHSIQFKLKEYNKSVLKIATNKAVFSLKVAVQSYETQFMALD